MPTMEEIRTGWKAIRSALGNVICYIEGKTTQLGEAEQSWNKGYDCGYADGVKSGYDASPEDYKKGFEDCWEIARRIVKMDVHELAKVFFPDAVAVTHDEPFTKYTVHEAIQKLKEYDEIRVNNSNAQKFVEVFGFMPGYEITEDGKLYFPSLQDVFWNAEYVPPEETDEVPRL